VTTTQGLDGGRAPRIARGTAIVVILALVLLPIYWLIMSSFRPGDDVFRYTTQFSLDTLLPRRLTFDHYRAILGGDFPRAVFNSLFVSLVTVALGLLVNSAAGFAFAVFEFPFKTQLFVMVLISFMMPFEAIVIPLYQLMRWTGLVNTYAALILPDVASGIVIFLFRQFFAAIPRQIYEAARIDGASWWTIYWRMTLPLSGPTLATASLMMFIHQWDAFFWPLVAASTPDLVLVQVAIARNMTLEQSNWGALFASASTAILVALVPFLFLQRYYVRVVVLGADR
jgi:ABC-type glycerol-3-phosphate transport system permease component